LPGKDIIKPALKKSRTWPKSLQAQYISISRTNNGYLFEYFYTSAYILTGEAKISVWKKLSFYFGGSDKAYHDMNCEITNI